MTTRTLSAAVVTATAAAILATLAPTADAAPTDCRAGLVCAWEDAGFTGAITVMSNLSSTLAGQTFSNGHAVANAISSVVNRSALTYCLYTETGFSHLAAVLTPNTQIDSLGAVNDRVKSARATTAGC